MGFHMDKRRSRLGRLLAAAMLSPALLAGMAACGSGQAPPASSNKPYVPPEASDTPTLDPNLQLIPEGPLFLPLGRWAPSPTSQTPLNPCLQQSFVVLGAETTRYRSFHGTRTDAQGQDFVAVFHDTYAARQAAYLLRRWQQTCASTVHDKSVTALPLNWVNRSSVWFATYKKRASGGYDRYVTGVVQKGRVVAMVNIQDTSNSDNPAFVQSALVRMVNRGYARLE